MCGCAAIRAGRSTDEADAEANETRSEAIRGSNPLRPGASESKDFPLRKVCPISFKLRG